MIKDKLGGEEMKKYVGLPPKTYSWIKENDEEEKRQKEPKNEIKQKIKFDDYKTCFKKMKFRRKSNF